MFKAFLISSVLLLSCFVSTTQATLPKVERQQLIHERAIKEAQARRQRIEDRKSVSQYYYYYQYQYSYPHHHYHPRMYYQPSRTFYFWYRF